MTVTLSSPETAKKIYESGIQGFLTAVPTSRESSPLSLALVDFDKVLQHPEAPKIIQALPPQILYHSLMVRGVHDCLEVLPHLSTEQFVRICDYDIWHEDKLVPKRLFTWLSYYRELSPAQMVERFRSLDEEYQIAIMSPFIRTYTPEEYEKMTDVQQDSLYRFPGDALFYEITSPEKEIHEGIEQLMEASMGVDMNYAMALVSYASYQLVGESELQMQQFRNARLEEDGFVTYEESLSIFVPLNWKELEAKWPNVSTSSGEDARGLLAAVEDRSNQLFLKHVLQQGVRAGWSEEKIETLHRGFLYLSNALCSACHIEADDLHGLKRLLTHSQGLCSLALEALSRGDVERATLILAEEAPQRLFRAGLGLVQELRQIIMDELLAAKVSGAETLAKYLRQHKSGAMLDYMDRHMVEVLGFEETELLKGLFNRLPLLPIPQQSQEVGASGTRRIVFAPLQSCGELKAGWAKIQEVLASIRSTSRSN
jgi:hypothetical protein